MGKLRSKEKRDKRDAKRWRNLMKVAPWLPNQVYAERRFRDNKMDDDVTVNVWATLKKLIESRLNPEQVFDRLLEIARERTVGYGKHCLLWTTTNDRDTPQTTMFRVPGISLDSLFALTFGGHERVSFFWHASHLCGNQLCIRHLRLESPLTNTSRDYCQKYGFSNCEHVPKCVSQRKLPPMREFSKQAKNNPDFDPYRSTAKLRRKLRKALLRGKDNFTSAWKVVATRLRREKRKYLIRSNSSELELLN